MLTAFLQRTGAAVLVAIDCASDVFEVLRDDALRTARAHVEEWRALAQKAADEAATLRAQLDEAQDACAELSGELHRARGNVVSFKKEIKSPRAVVFVGADEARKEKKRQRMRRRRADVKAALSVTCPTCGAMDGARCLEPGSAPNSERQRAPHGDRIAKARAG